MEFFSREAFHARPATCGSLWFARGRMRIATLTASSPPQSFVSPAAAATGSQLPIIGLGMIEEAIKIRKHKPMFFVDLAVPADIEKEIENLDDTFLYNLDDLEC